MNILRLLFDDAVFAVPQSFSESALVDLGPALDRARSPVPRLRVLPPPERQAETVTSRPARLGAIPRDVWETGSFLLLFACAVAGVLVSFLFATLK
jgi:hypothetical protein